MAKLTITAALLSALLLVAGCGGSHRYTLAKTQACLRDNAAAIGVGATVPDYRMKGGASGGTLAVAVVGGPNVVVAFAKDDAEVRQLVTSMQASARGAGVAASVINALMVTKGNTVLLAVPAAGVTSLPAPLAAAVEGCLR